MSQRRDLGVDANSSEETDPAEAQVMADPDSSPFDKPILETIRMSYNWVQIQSSPPRQRRNEVREICRRYGGRLIENQIFYDARNQAYALVQVPADQRQALLAAIGATEWLGLVDADEKDSGAPPPASGRPN